MPGDTTDSERNELLVNVLSPRVDTVSIKVRCDSCDTVNHWQRWQMSELPECPGESGCVCWHCGDRNAPPSVGMAIYDWLVQVMDMDQERSK